MNESEKKEVARRAAYAHHGRCKCGRAYPAAVGAKAEPKPQAPALAAKQAEARAKAAPPVVIGTPVGEARSQLLEQVYEKFHDLTMSQFGQWLNAELAKAKPIRQSKESSSSRGAVFGHHKLRVVGGK